MKTSSREICDDGVAVIYGNPLGLPILADLPQGITKGQLADKVLGEMTFDYALPQLWLNHWKGNQYERMLCRCVTAYPPEYRFGVVVDLITGNLYPL